MSKARMYGQRNLAVPNKYTDRRRACRTFPRQKTVADQRQTRMTRRKQG